jgi:acetate kinase
LRVLVLNAGSATLKWTLLDGEARTVLQAESAEWRSPDLAARAEQVRATLRAVPAFDAVGHRVVHGRRFSQATLVDRAVRDDLEALAALDDLHMRPALAGIDAVTAAFPAAPQVAAFDTAFHTTLSDAAAGYALPHEWSERWGLRRFGFHGLSVAWAVERAEALLRRVPPRLIVCHLGSGCSITAVAEGRSIDTSMGFTPLDGVMMGTRSGSVDPGLLLHVLQRCGVSVAELEDVLERRAGLLGVSGVSGDLRRVLAAADEGVPRAQLAYAQFVWTLRRAVGAMAGVLDGVDAIVFTGGIGEQSARVREEVSASLGFAGLRLAPGGAMGEGGDGDRIISTPGSSVAVLVVHAREDLVILGEVLRLARHLHT